MILIRSKIQKFEDLRDRNSHTYQKLNSFFTYKPQLWKFETKSSHPITNCNLPLNENGSSKRNFFYYTRIFSTNFPRKLVSKNGHFPITLVYVISRSDDRSVGFTLESRGFTGRGKVTGRVEEARRAKRGGFGARRVDPHPWCLDCDPRSPGIRPVGRNRSARVCRFAGNATAMGETAGAGNLIGVNARRKFPEAETTREVLTRRRARSWPEFRSRP